MDYSEEENEYYDNHEETVDSSKEIDYHEETVDSSKEIDYHEETADSNKEIYCGHFYVTSMMVASTGLVSRPFRRLAPRLSRYKTFDINN